MYANYSNLQLVILYNEINKFSIKYYKLFFFLIEQLLSSKIGKYASKNFY
jgi:hypothetical protein